MALEYYVYKPQRVLLTLYIVLDSSRRDSITSLAWYQCPQMVMYQICLLMPARLKQFTNCNHGALSLTIFPSPLGEPISTVMPSAFKPTIRSLKLVTPNLLNAVWILSCIPAAFAFFKLSTLKYQTNLVFYHLKTKFT